MVLASYQRMFETCARIPAPGAMRIIDEFLDHMLPEALRLGWSEVELFGCYPDPTFAAIRYDCMGAVTIAELTGTPIASVSATEIRGRTGLASRRPLPNSMALPVWDVFPG